MGNSVWGAGFHAGEEAMKKVVAGVSIGGVLATAAAFFLGQAKGRKDSIDDVSAEFIKLEDNKNECESEDENE